MIPFQEASGTVLDIDRRMPAECISFSSSLGRVLAEDVFSDMDMPPFDKSSMDGFACRMADLASDLRIIETIPAGKWPEKKINKYIMKKMYTEVIWDRMWYRELYKVRWVAKQILKMEADSYSHRYWMGVHT